MTLETWTEDSELGAWTQHDWRPPQLAGAVESIWLFDGQPAQRRERHYPNGALDLIVQLDGAAPHRLFDGRHASVFPTACLAGQLVRPVEIEAPAERTRVLGVRLRPAGAYALTGVPLRELTGAAVGVDDLLGGDARRLVDQLEAADGDRTRLRLIGRWLAARLATDVSADPDVRYVVSEIERTGGQAPIAGIVERIGRSPRRLTQAFEEQIGVKPKLYARIVRFRGLAEALPGSAQTLGQAALAHGYYDQSHMNADFREFAGMSPGRFLAEMPAAEPADTAGRRTARR
jgi:AraC-like DNA-binding protein